MAIDQANPTPGSNSPADTKPEDFESEYTRLMDLSRQKKYDDLAQNAVLGDQGARDQLDQTNSTISNLGKAGTSFVSGALRSVAGVPGYIANTLDPNQIGQNDGVLKGIQSGLNSAADSVDRFGTSDSTVARDALDKALVDQARSKGGETGAFVQGVKNIGRSPTAAVEGISSMAGAMAPQIAITAALSATGVGAPIAGALAFGAGSAGNVQDQKYKELVSMPEDQWLSNPEYAQNPTAENKKYIAQNIAAQVGHRDMAINTAFGVLGPAQGIAKSFASKEAQAAAEGAQTALRANGLAGQSDGLFSNAVRPYVASKGAVYGSAIAKDVAVFEAQTTAATVNQNLGSQEIDKNVSTTQGLGQAMAESLPAALLFGAKSGMSKRAEAKAVFDQAGRAEELARQIYANGDLTLSEAAKQASEEVFKPTSDGRPNPYAADAQAHVESKLEASKDEINQARANRINKEEADRKAADDAVAATKAKEEADAAEAAKPTTDDLVKQADAEVAKMVDPESVKATVDSANKTETVAADPLAESSKPIEAKTAETTEMSPERDAIRRKNLPKVIEFMVNKGIDILDQHKRELEKTGQETSKVAYNKDLKPKLFEALTRHLGSDELAKKARGDIHSALGNYWQQVRGLKGESKDFSDARSAKFRSDALERRTKHEAENKFSEDTIAAKAAERQAAIDAKAAEKEAARIAKEAKAAEVEKAREAKKAEIESQRKLGKDFVEAKQIDKVITKTKAEKEAAQAKALQERKAKEKLDAIDAERDRLFNEESKVQVGADLVKLSPERKVEWTEAENRRDQKLSDIEARADLTPKEKLAATKVIEREHAANQRRIAGKLSQADIKKAKTAEIEARVKAKKEEFQKRLAENPNRVFIKDQFADLTPDQKKRWDAEKLDFEARKESIEKASKNQAEAQSRIHALEMDHAKRKRAIAEIWTSKEMKGLNRKALEIKPGDSVRFKSVGREFMGTVKESKEHGKFLLDVDGQERRIFKKEAEKVTVDENGVPQKVLAPFPELLLRDLGDGSTSVSKGVTDKMALEIRDMIKSLPIKNLGEGLAIVKSYKEALAHDPVRLKQVQDMAGPNGRVAGMYDHETKTVFIFTDHITSKEEAMKTILHEVSHRGFDLLMDGKDSVEFTAKMNRLYNENKTLRDITKDLIDRKIISENSSPTVKLFEALAVATEQNSKHLTRSMSTNAVVRTIAKIREFLHDVISRVMSKEIADKFLGSMPDAELIRVLRLGLNEGFKKSEEIYGQRATVMNGDSTSTIPLLRNVVVDRTADYLNEASRNGGVIGDVAGRLGKAVDRIGVERGPSFVDRYLKTTLGRGYKNEGVKDISKALEAAENMKSSLANDITRGNSMAMQRRQMTDGSLSGAGREMATALKSVLPTEQRKEMRETEAVLNTVFSKRNAEGRHEIMSESDFINEAKATGMTDAAAKRSYADYDSVNRGARLAAEHVLKSEIHQITAQLEGVMIDPLAARATSLDVYSDRLNDAISSQIQKATSAGNSELVSRLKTIKRLVEAELDHFDSQSNVTQLQAESKGKYVNSIYAQDGSLVSQRAFEKKGDADQHFSELKRDNPTMDVRAETLSTADRKIPSDHLDLINAIDAAKKSLGRDLTQAEISDLKIRQIEKSIRELATRQKRRETQVATGVKAEKIENVVKAYGEQVQRDSETAATKMYGADLSNGFAKIGVGEGALRDDMIKLMNQLSTPESEAAMKLKGFMYNTSLGFSLGSAVMQKFQNYILGAPVLNVFAKQDALTQARTFGVMAKADLDVMRGGLRGLDGYKADGNHRVGSEAALIADLIDRGVLADHEAVRFSELTNNAIGNKVPALGAVLRAGSAFFATAEMSNRIAIAVALHRLVEAGAVDRSQVNQFRDMTSFAQHVINEAHFNTARFNKPGIARNELGGIITQFKMFPIMMLESMARMPVQQRLQCIAALGLLGGVSGLPFAQNLIDVSDIASEISGNPINTKGKIIEGLRKVGLQDEGIGVAFGGVGRLANTEIGSRIGIGNIVPMVHAFLPSNQRRSQDIIDGFGVSASYISNMVDAVGSAAKGETRQALQSVAPAFARNAYNGAELAVTGKALNAKGELIKDYKGKEGQLVVDSALKSVGINNTSMAEYAEGKQVQTRDQEVKSLISAKMVNDLAAAFATNDQANVARVQKEIFDHNRANLGTPNVIKFAEIMTRARTDYKAQQIAEIDRKLKNATGPKRAELIAAKSRLND